MSGTGKDGILPGTEIRTNLPGAMAKSPVASWPSAEPVMFEGYAFLALEDRPVFRELPDELYLREARITDPRNVDDVASFVRSFGGLTGSFRRSEGPVESFLRYAPGSHTQSFGSTVRTPSRSSVFERLLEAEKLDAHYVVPVEIIGYHLQMTRAMTGHLVAAQEDQDPREAWKAEGFEIGMKRTAPGLAFEETLNAALRPYSPWFAFGAGAVPTRPEMTAYTEMALQIANSLVSGELFKRCQNPTCIYGGWFVHQRGSNIRPRSIGVDYCSAQCRDTQRKRLYRARKRKESAR